jgi:hypothetical protein
MAPAADHGNHHCMAMIIKQLRVASDDDLIEAHDEVASYHRLGWLPDEDRVTAAALWL